MSHIRKEISVQLALLVSTLWLFLVAVCVLYLKIKCVLFRIDWVCVVCILGYISFVYISVAVDKSCQ